MASLFPPPPVPMLMLRVLKPASQPTNQTLDVKSVLQQRTYIHGDAKREVFTIFIVLTLRQLLEECNQEYADFGGLVSFITFF
jgi:hypothetical protein